MPGGSRLPCTRAGSGVRARRGGITPYKHEVPGSSPGPPIAQITALAAPAAPLQRSDAAAVGAEAHGLLGLMELHASRSRSRTGPSGEPVLLLDQDRGRWDWLLVRRGLAALERCLALGGSLGPYALQAGIAACHARAR